MWQVKNTTPFAAQGYFVRDRDGFEHWAVAIRARFRLSGNDYPRIVDQQPVRLAPVYADKQSRELRADSDLCPFRPKPDIILHGAVEPPDHGGNTRLLSLRLGKIEKKILAYNDRRASKVEGQWRVERDKFTPFKLSWRQALGGEEFLGTDNHQPRVHPANPIGIGWSPDMSKLADGVAFDLPRLENPAHLLNHAHALPAPVGFGPILPAWQPRLNRAGTYDTAWQANRAPRFPVDFSETFHQSAPDDQIYPEELRGGEPVMVEELAGGPLAFRLPQIIFTARTRIARTIVDSRFRLILVEIDASARTLDMVWNMSVPCPGGDHLVQHSFIFMPQMSGVLR